MSGILILDFAPRAQIKSFQGYILAPLGVKPDHQKRGIGAKLIDTGIRQLARMGVNVLSVYGDPEYYSRYAFSPDAAERYSPPYRLQYPFRWRGMVLNACSTEGSSSTIACVTSLFDPELW